MKNQNEIPFLVVSSSPYMRGILKFILETMLKTEVAERESEEKALLFLKNLSEMPSMIIYDYTPNAYLLEDFVGYLRENSKHVNIIILVDKVREEGKDLLKDLRQIKLMDESLLPQSLIDEAEDMFRSSEHINESEYCRIQIDFLSILDGINKDLYLKFGNDKYIKLFNEDDNTNVLDIKKYKEKGLEYLYLKRSTSMWVVEQIQKQISIFLKANNFRFILRGAGDTPQRRFEQRLLRIDDEIHIDAEFEQSIETTIDRIRALIEKESSIAHILKLIREQQDQYVFFTHKIHLTSIIACLLAKQLDWISKLTMDKIVYASVLCDLTLAVRPDLIKIKSLAEFEKKKADLSEEDRKLFLCHPKDAANLIKRYFTNAPPDTDALAYQHHELPDGSGFPMGLRAEKISPLSALFIVANDFSYYFLLDEEPTMDDYLLKCQSRFDYVNFRKVMKALEKVRRK